MRVAPLSILLHFGLSSCGIYTSHFDCPPGKGVGCASVGDVLDMIVEKDAGEDLFLKHREKPTKRERLIIIRDDSGALILVPEKEGDKK